MKPDDHARHSARERIALLNLNAFFVLNRETYPSLYDKIRVTDFGSVTFGADGTAFVECVMEIPPRHPSTLPTEKSAPADTAPAGTP